MADLPVDDASVMQEEESKDDLSRVESCPVFVKLAGSLDLEHEISTVDVLHNKEQPLLLGGEGRGREELYNALYIYVHTMRDERRKEGRKKQARSNKQTNNKAKQHSTPKAVTFPKKNELHTHIHTHTVPNNSLPRATSIRK